MSNRFSASPSTRAGATRRAAGNVELVAATAYGTLKASRGAGDLAAWGYGYVYGSFLVLGLSFDEERDGADASQRQSPGFDYPGDVIRHSYCSARSRRWRRRESNPRPRSRDGDVYERIRRSVLALSSPRRRGC